jgi:hypothetical protein
VREREALERCLKQLEQIDEQDEIVIDPSAVASAVERLHGHRSRKLPSCAPLTASFLSYNVRARRCRARIDRSVASDRSGCIGTFLSGLRLEELAVPFSRDIAEHVVRGGQTGDGSGAPRITARPIGLGFQLLMLATRPDEVRCRNGRDKHERAPPHKSSVSDEPSRSKKCRHG